MIVDASVLIAAANDRDGFAGPVTLELADPPPGYSLLGATIPAGKDSVQGAALRSV